MNGSHSHTSLSAVRIAGYRIHEHGMSADEQGRVRQLLAGLAVENRQGPCDAIIAVLPSGMRRVDPTAYGDIGRATVILLAKDKTHEPSTSLFGGSIVVLGPGWAEDHLRMAVRTTAGRSGIRRERSESGDAESAHAEATWGSVIAAAPQGGPCPDPQVEAASAMVPSDLLPVQVSVADGGCTVMAPPGATALVHRPGALPAVFVMQPETPLRAGDVCLIAVGGDPDGLRRAFRAWSAASRRRPAGLALGVAVSCRACIVVESRRG